jgi:hypothetical protein
MFVDATSDSRPQIQSSRISLQPHSTESYDHTHEMRGYTAASLPRVVCSFELTAVTMRWFGSSTMQRSPVSGF